MKLTAKQALFCKEYMIDLNATQAAKRAGYSQKTAFRIGQENLHKPSIEAELTRLMAETSKRISISVDDVIERIWDIAVDGAEENNRLKALDMMMKHLGGYEKDKEDKAPIEKQSLTFNILPKND